MAAAAALQLDEIVEEILLRFPPDDPARLLDAALVCKRWCRILAAAGFRRRFRELHRTPPLLGFLGNIPHTNLSCAARFVPTSSFHPRRADHIDWYALHSGHGRILFCNAPLCYGGLDMRFLVCDPITDERRVLPALGWCPFPSSANWNALVLCAAGGGGGCNYLDCHRGPFLVFFVANLYDEVVASVYSSATDAWSEPTSMLEPDGHRFCLWTKAQALVGNSLYIKYQTIGKLLKYDLPTREMSVIRLPAECSKQHIVLMVMEDGRLGFAAAHDSRLYLWSREDGPNGDAGWVQLRVIELRTLLPFHHLPITPNVVGVADGVGVIFIEFCGGIFTLDLKSKRIKKLEGSHVFCDGVLEIVPFMTFCTPELGAARIGDGSGAGASSA
ncbi:unnamed protein product [Urochloa decumbens]|uniref:F-box domain-containing protein n=1 Tax=Urochloa decumbens TaxID=240449 RepID=A0ABC9GV76_9POAL